MNALRFLETGPITNLLLTRAPRPVLQTGEALIRVKAAGINGSDAANIRGWLPMTTVPRIPGRDFSGVVVDLADEELKEQWIGKEVWGTGGDRGISEDGTYAEYVKVSASSLSRKPLNLTHNQAASITLPWICAWIAVEKLGNVKCGDNVLIIGARGGIGAAAIQLCLSRGANVLGTYRNVASSDVPLNITPIEISDPKSLPIRSRVAELGLKNNIDVLIDCAGYEDPFNDALFTMIPDGTGRVVVMAAHKSDGRFSLDLRTMYTKALTLKGLRSGILGPIEVKGVLDYISEKFDAGSFKVPEVDFVRLTDESGVQAALSDVLTRSSPKRTVVVVE